jgi:hypothetical protein
MSSSCLLGPKEQACIMYWRIHDLWGPTNLVASFVTETEAIPPYLQDDNGIVYRPPTDAQLGIPWKTCIRVRWARIVSLIVSQNVATRGVFMTSRVSCCQVYPFQGCKLVQICTTLSKMSDGLIAMFKHSNSAFIMLILFMRMILTTL